MHGFASRLESLWRDLDSLQLETTGLGAIEDAKRLMADPGLSPRDAFHAAHALASGCPVIVSTDPDFDRVPALRRVGP